MWSVYLLYTHQGANQILSVLEIFVLNQFNFMFSSASLLNLKVASLHITVQV